MRVSARRRWEALGGILRGSILAVCLACLFCQTAEASAASESSIPLPNIVLILADDLGYGDLGCYGAEKIDTPHADRLAAEGMRFTDAHSPHSVCTPTRYSLLTGRYAWRTWAGSGTVWANDPLLIEPGRETIASLLGKAGYDTAAVGKWHLGFGAPGQSGWDELRGPDYNLPLKPGPLEVGFDSFFGIPHVGQLPHIYIRDHHVVGLEKLEQPLRLKLDENPMFRQPYLERPRHEGKTPWHILKNAEPISYQHEELAVRLTEEAVQYLDTRDGQRPFFLYFAHRNPHGPHRPHPRFKGTSEIGVYGDCIHEFDWSVGEVLEALDRRGLTENTLVLLSSDNGGVRRYSSLERAVIEGHYLNGPLRGQKCEVYEGGHRVPLLVRWPGVVASGSENDGLVALTDVFATLTELLGQTVDERAGEDSFSFLSLLLRREAQWPKRTQLVSDSARNRFAIREGDWKLIPYQGGGYYGLDDEPDLAQPAGQLYNLAEDIGETTNLYEERPEIVARLTDLLEALTAMPRTAPAVGQR